MIISVTGTPGTGKTLYAKKLATEKNLKYIDVNELIKFTKIFDSYNKELNSFEVDIKKLNTVLIMLINKFKKDNTKSKKYNGLVLDSHLSHYLQPKYLDLCIVTRCSLKNLKKRLEKRGYSKAKIFDNIQAEIFETCLQEAQEKGHKVKIIHTDG